MISIRFTVLLTAAFLLAPVASAGSAPVIGFLADSDAGPVVDGALILDWPTSNESAARPVLQQAIAPSVFVDGTERAGTHLRGSVFMGLWPDAGIAKDSILVASLLIDGVAVANGSAVVNVDPGAAPDPLSFMPPDPTDPEGAVFHAAGKVLPLILQPPTLIQLGFIDMEIPAEAEVALSFGLASATSGPATAVAMVLKYDGMLSPSFVYLPWWSADPAVVSPQLPPAQPAAPAMEPEPEPAQEEPAASKDSPGVGLLAVMLSFVGIALLRRR